MEVGGARSPRVVIDVVLDNVNVSTATGLVHCGAPISYAAA